MSHRPRGDDSPDHFERWFFGTLLLIITVGALAGVVTLAVKVFDSPEQAALFAVGGVALSVAGYAYGCLLDPEAAAHQRVKDWIHR